MSQMVEIVSEDSPQFFVGESSDTISTLTFVRTFSQFTNKLYHSMSIYILYKASKD